MTRNRGRMTRRRVLFSILVSAILTVAGTGLFANAAHAQSLDDLRASGVVGEGADGYAKVRVAGGNAQSAVDAVNAQRREIYAGQASKGGTSIDEVGRVFAGKIFARQPAGTWFQDLSGRWTQK